MGRYKLCVVLVHLAVFSESARILGIIPTPSYSHQIGYQPLWEALSRRGHDVVVFTTNPVNDPTLTNLTEVDISFSYKLIEDYLGRIEFSEVSYWRIFKFVAEFFIEATKMQMEHPTFQNLLKNESEHFDLVIAETLFPVYGAFAHKFNSPLIGACSFEPWNEWLAAMGNPLSPAAFPNPNLPFYRDLSFKDRMIISLYQYGLIPLRAYLYDDSVDNLVYEYFGKDYPRGRDFFANIDLLFSNTNPVLKINVPTLPTIVEFGGGVHIKPQQPLPEDIKSFLDASTKGVIYFSFGTNVPTSLLSQQQKTLFLETVSELPYDVLWKFDLDDNVQIPSNVKVMKWIPQQDVLRHPKIKAFITQGGLQSLEEALYSHVPLISVPFQADQGRNAKIIEYLNIGTSFNIETMEKEPFKNAIIKIAEDPSYKERMRKLAKLSKDQPMENIDKLVWWTEYVIRNNGAKHLRSVVADIPFYQYYLLDVISFSVFIIVGLFYISFKLLGCIFGCFSKKSNIKIKQQ